jgi:hypothetical protein
MTNLTDIAFPFKTDKDVIHWQHEITSQVFKTQQNPDGTLHLWILQAGGRWQDNGNYTAEGLVKLATNLK